MTDAVPSPSVAINNVIPRNSRIQNLALIAMLIVIAGLLGRQALEVWQAKSLLGRTTQVEEIQTGITFNARVDTGAAVSSIHCLEFTIADEMDDPQKNLGKPVRFRVTNEHGQAAWIETTVADYAAIRTSDATKSRYYVRLHLKCAGVEKETLVTLKDRNQMQFKLLLGRDFLENDFVVDVSQ